MNEGSSVQRLGRATGLLYVVVVVFGMFSPIVVETLVVPGDAVATAGNVLGSLWLFRASLVSWIVLVVTDVVISVVLYLLFETTGRALSLISASFRAVYSTILGAFLLHLFSGYVLLTDPAKGAVLGVSEARGMALVDFETFGAGFALALAFFGVHLILFGALLKRSRYVPAVLAVLMAVAGVGYIVNSLATFFVPSHGDVASTLLLMPALVGEVGLTVWLLWKGVSVATERAHAHVP